MQDGVEGRRKKRQEESHLLPLDLFSVPFLQSESEIKVTSQLIPDP
jgi:hypothetical protein